MSNMVGLFDGISFKKIEGYRLSACYSPGGGGGFAGNFYITLLDRTQAGAKFTEGVDLGSGGTARRGDLEFKDGYRTYSFKKIDLVSIEAGVTRNQRYRLLQFRYDTTFGSTESLEITMSNSSKEKLADNPLQKDYDASMTGTSEHLLGYRSRLAIGEANVQRFVTLRAGDNSMLTKLVEIANKERQQQGFPEFQIEFSRGAVKVNQTTISKLYVHESYGSFHAAPLPSLAAIRAVQDDVNLIPNVLKVDLNDYSTRELLEHNDKSALESFRDNTTQVVTLVLGQGPAQSLIVT